MRIQNFLLIGLPVVFVAGCVNSHQQREVVYTTPVVVPAPTSQSTIVRVYPEYPSPGVPNEDISTAETVRDMIATDPDLKLACRNVDIEIKNRRAILRGTVATDHERREIRDRIARVGGIDRVDDRLKVAIR